MVDYRYDRLGIIELLLNVWAEEDPYRSLDDPEAMVQAELERSLDAPCFGVLATDTNGIWAVVIVTPSKTDAATLTWLTVRRDVRDRGLATGLLRVVMDALSADGVRQLASATSPANVASLRWHLNRGFQLAEDLLREALRPHRRLR